MPDILDFSLENFIENVRFVDLLDVLLISVFLYLLLNWLRRSVSNRSLVGLSILITVYVFARLTDMYLTELLIQGLFIIILIGTVVVFQSDIRRLIDRLGNWEVFRKTPAASRINVATDIIAEAASRMADEKTGALIVIRGNDPWERHIHGGIKLGGEISLPFLLSIFNPNSPGHDGAVLVEDHKVRRFGTHLPLSTNLDRSAGGTRHAAALGMAEHCDALVVVVSEERGVISVAQSGRLYEVESGSELKTILDDFWNTHYETRERTWMDWWKKRDLKTAAASFAIAAGLWLAFAYQTETVYRTFSVPIEYRNLHTSEVVLQDSVPMEARITLAASEQAFRSMDPSQLVVSFNMAAQDTGIDELLITENNLNLPADVSLYEVSPRSLKVKAREFEEIEIPVKIATMGELPPALELVSIRAVPSRLDILVDNPTENMPDSIATQPVDLSQVEGTDTLMQKPVLPPGMKLTSNSPSQISVIVEVKQDVR